MDTSVIARLRERKVVQWGLAYLAGAWVLAQVSHLVGQQFDWPTSVLRAITVLLAFGVLPALVIAWFHGEQGAQHVSRREALLLAALVAVGGGIAWWMAYPVPEEPLEPAVPASFSATRIAVLPFDDFSPDSDQQFLGDGIADTLMRVFAGIEELTIIARASAFAYRGRDIATIARELEVGSVLEGSVQRADDRLRIVAQLVRTADQSQVWSLTFERPAGDIFAIQDEIAQQVVDALLGTGALGLERHRLARTDTAAYDLYMQGRELWQTRQPADAHRAVELLERAVELDPGFAPARSELATVLFLLRGESDLGERSRVEAEIDEALSLDPEDAQAHAIRGLLLTVYGRLDEGRAALQQALALRPNDVNILGWLGNSYRDAGMMGTAGRYFQRAFELDPMNVFARTRLVAHLGADLSPEALVLARQTVRLFPESRLAWYSLLTAHMQRADDVGQVLAAVDALDHVADPEPFVFAIATVFNRLGEHALADRWRARIPGYSAGYYGETMWFVLRGEADAAVAKVRELMEQWGETPGARAWLGRALISTGDYDDAWSVLSRFLDEGPPLDEPANVSWGHAEIAVLLAGLAHRRGETERAERLEAAVLRIIERIEADWPRGAQQRRHFLHIAMRRADEASAYLETLYSNNLETALLVRDLDWFADLRETRVGQAFLEDMEQERARQMQQLRETGIPWLLEPEQWSPP
jgi:TolB-like protein/tetratricopeptide (TPR) repeat protein